LEEAGCSVVIQAWDFRPGSNFVLEMQQAATMAERTIAVLSNDYLDALYTQPEWAAAFVQDPMSKRGVLLPVRVRPCELKGLLASLIYIDFVEQEEGVARQRLLDGIHLERAKPNMAPAFPGARKEPHTTATRHFSREPLSLLPEHPPFPKGFAPLMSAIEVFYVFAPEDEELRADLEKQLAFLKTLGLITDWHSGRIHAGQERMSENENHLRAAQIILLLISAHFMASDSYDIAKQAMEKYEAGSARVIPIILRPVDWKGAPFDHLEVLPTNRQPVTSWTNRDEAFFNVAQGIRNVVEELSLPPL
jgi:TIR domain